MSREVNEEGHSPVEPVAPHEEQELEVLSPGDEEPAAVPSVEARVRAALPRLRILPLPSSVLLPGAALSLWLYDPRHRALVQDAAAGDAVLAVALSLPPDAQHPRSRLRRVAGAGVIGRHRRLASGAWEVELRGVLSARLAGEIPSERPYRLMSAEPIEEEPGETALAPELRRLVLQLAPTAVGREAARLARAAAEERDANVLANLVAAALIEEPEARQAVLEERRAAARIELVIGELAKLWLRLCGKAGPLARG